MIGTARQLVAGIDSAANVYTDQVVGNKADTVAGDSLVALAKQVLALHGIPGLDSADNVNLRDVVGRKGDASYNGGTSLMALLHTLEEHAHAMSLVLPDLGGYAVATAAAGAWTYGVESASLGTPADDFDIHWLEIVANGNDDYQVRISVDGTPVSYTTFRRIAASVRSFSKRISMPVVPAGPVTIAIATASGGSTADFKAEYHLY